MVLESPASRPPCRSGLVTSRCSVPFTASWGTPISTSMTTPKLWSSTAMTSPSPSILVFFHLSLRRSYFYFFTTSFVDSYSSVYIHRTIGDQPGEAKASGNIGNTLKVLGRFDEAIFFCQNHLDISRILHDKVKHF